MGVDESKERALEQAQDVVSLPGTDEIAAEIVHGFAENPEGTTIQQVPAVREVKDVLESEDIEVTLREGSGDPASEIVRIADELDADMINVAGRKRTPTGKVIFGSVTQAVILHTDRPVLVSSADS
jgi:hypothetical protein